MLYHIGGPKASLHFLWKIEDSEGDRLNKCVYIIRKIEEDAPIYEKKIIKRGFKHTFGFVGSPVVLRAIFRDLTNDNTSANSLNEKEIDLRFEHAMLCEDPSILVGLQHQSPNVKEDSFSVSLEATEKFLKNDVGVACHERWHGEQLYLAKAVSFQNLHRQVKEIVPQGTKIPSVKWLRYQFQPIKQHANTAKYYKGSMNIKMMVQKRQIRVNHVDSHYCAAMWRYM
ncbi:Hypothetical predicted protein [Paramuricea clavata]|uniref:Uncharacterized protein n=1 Tax=Paramuricea clavata TaxID=317549 RepID=A0A7D9JB15_PARCT|nr:Hypothetical predicted protein [Paramuricea clavata]